MRYYVYTHSDKDGNVFYIGKGTNKRAWDKNRGKAWEKKVEELGEYVIDVPYNKLTEHEALDLEALLIETHGIDNLVNKVKPLVKENRCTSYYDIMQKAKDLKVLMEIYDNFDYYYKIPFFKKHIKLIHRVHQLREEYGLL